MAAATWRTFWGREEAPAGAMDDLRYSRFSLPQASIFGWWLDPVGADDETVLEGWVGVGLQGNHVPPSHRVYYPLGV